MKVEKFSTGTVKIHDGWLSIYNAKGQEVASIKPTDKQWLQLNAEIADALRYPHSRMQ